MGRLRNEFVSVLHVKSFCGDVNPKIISFSKNTGAAGVPIAMRELTIYVLQPYLLCTWVSNVPGGTFDSDTKAATSL